jgi:hypothetical protein
MSVRRGGSRIKKWLNRAKEICAMHFDPEKLESGDLSRHRDLNALLKLVIADSYIWQTRVRNRRRNHAGR